MSNGNTANGYLRDALMIGKDGSDFRINTYKVHKDYTSNMPTGCNLGIRRCQQLDSNWTQVIIEEYDPIPGRVWTITNNGTTWTNWSESALKSDLTNAIVFRGVFTGDLNKASSGEIDAGYYTIRAADTVSSAPSGAAWCTFIQFSGDYHIQLIVQPNFLAVRRYAGSPVQWTGWSKYNES